VGAIKDAISGQGAIKKASAVMVDRASPLYTMQTAKRCVANYIGLVAQTEGKNTEQEALYRSLEDDYIQVNAHMKRLVESMRYLYKKEHGEDALREFDNINKGDGYEI